uniref:Rho-GAP domain-containing protein n=1 Tax=Haplochromis burtoni TaxID=8153 RepID=A0A3Q2WHH1_HAPBU
KKERKKGVRRKGGNKEKVFGCDLLEHLNTSGQEVPLVLRCCSEFVEHHGIVDGIYRLSGVSSNIQKLR